MKVYQLLHFPLEGAGAGAYADTLARGLIRRGHKSRVLATGHHLRPRPYAVDLVRFRNAQNMDSDLPFDFPVLASHPLSGGPTFGELSEAQRKLYLSVLRTRIANGISAFQPDLLHVHHGWAIGALVAEMGVPYVVTLHGTELRAFMEFGDYRQMVLDGLHGARVVLAPTCTEKEEAVRAYGLQPANVTVVRPGVDTSFFRPIPAAKNDVLRRYPIPASARPIILYCGRLVAEKGVDVLLRAAQAYSTSDVKPLTIIAGEGRHRPALQRLARDLALTDVYFVGQQSRPNVRDLLNIADVVVMPSLVEPFGLTAVEALACGTPVVASRVGGLPDIVEDGMGHLVEAGNHRELSDRLSMCLADGTKQGLSKATVSHMTTRFRSDRAAEAVEAVYHRAIDALTSPRAASAPAGDSSLATAA